MTPWTEDTNAAIKMRKKGDFGVAMHVRCLDINNNASIFVFIDLSSLVLAIGLINKLFYCNSNIFFCLYCIDAMYATNRAAVCTVVSVQKKVPRQFSATLIGTAPWLNWYSENCAAWNFHCHGFIFVLPVRGLLSSKSQQSLFIIQQPGCFFIRRVILQTSPLSVLDNSETSLSLSHHQPLTTVCFPNCALVLLLHTFFFLFFTQEELHTFYWFSHF